MTLYEFTYNQNDRFLAVFVAALNEEHAWRLAYEHLRMQKIDEVLESSWEMVAAIYLRADVAPGVWELIQV